MSKTKAEIILEHVLIYYIDPSKRSIANTVRKECLYRSEDGRQCAFGRCIDPEKYKPNLEGKSLTVLISEKICLDDLLVEEYQGHGIDFWSDLQYNHDSAIYWNGEHSFDIRIKNLNRIIEIHISKDDPLRPMLDFIINTHLKEEENVA